MKKKLFGVALDPSDDPWSLELKQAWMARQSLKNGAPVEGYLDPYDAVTGNLKAILDSRTIQPAGKFPVPSWLWPRPNPEDSPRVNTPGFADFYDSGGLLSTIARLQDFIEKEILPAVPVMVGVDHSATISVVSALARKYGPENLSVIALDQHFDAIPLSLRIEGAGHGGQCCCGSFWDYLIDKGRLLPQNLSLIGVADYPGDLLETGSTPFQQSYLGFEAAGVAFFPLDRFQGPYLASLERFIQEKTRPPYVYLSLDLDVGSYNSIWAARYMDRPGLSAKHLLDVSSLIRNICRKKDIQLAGFDIMEFNMHFLGIETEDGLKDSTLSLVGDFISALLPGS